MARFLRVMHQGSPRFVELIDGALHLLDAAPWSGGKALGETLPVSSAPLAPVEPSKIICVAKNYREHAKEMQGEVPEEPLLFFKPPSSVLDPGGRVVLPPGVERTDFEAELGVVIGKRATRVTEAEAMAHVFGYTVVCDVTARDYQKKDRLWTRAKGFDTFCPSGPELVTDLEPDALRIHLAQNGETRQDGNIRDMVFSIAQVIAFASSFMTLEPGDLIATGTPHGVGPLASGDAIRIEIDGLEVLEFGVA
ncbi:MAG: fumarylacetoacetate hydrolase family protein [Polyangiaceae bacterium]|nr:fumarylacetoacetate hydrolase family protein [Myxococcales bacterium]MCB9589364.1 fumarylacetoacetate hydrolase family protein [Polyangiaceae bacterium]